MTRGPTRCLALVMATFEGKRHLCPSLRLCLLKPGLGITAEELPRLFERFYQGHSARQAKGSGLGLYLTRQIIEAHSGTIWAENRLPRGALFGFRLPAYPFQPLLST